MCNIAGKLGDLTNSRGFKRDMAVAAGDTAEGTTRVETDDGETYTRKYYDHNGNNYQGGKDYGDGWTATTSDVATYKSTSRSKKANATGLNIPT